MSGPDEVLRERAAQLLAGPRGRYLCAQAAQLADPTVTFPYDATDRAAIDLLLEQLTGLAMTPIAALADPLSLMRSLSASVDAARYWQAPDDRDQLLRDPRLVAALEPIARALVVAPASHWWWSPVDLGSQAILRWMDPQPTGSGTTQLTGTAERLHQWRVETLADEARAALERPTAYEANYSGSWWSVPALAKVPTTSRSINRLPAVQLELVEDSMGGERAQIAPVEVRRDRRVCEIIDPSDWTGLVDRYPLDVDRSRRHDWWRATGGTGPWQIPDWAAVGRDYDAVHLSVIGYLAGAGRALPTRNGQTVIAGFDPDLTYWLTDSLSPGAPAATWQRVELGDDDHVWMDEGVTA